MRLLIKSFLLVFTLSFFYSNTAAQTKNNVKQVYGTVTSQKENIVLNPIKSKVDREGFQLIDTNFYFSKLKLPLKIYVYIPKNYYNTKQKYPVVYLPEVSNFFGVGKENTSWNLNTLLDSLQQKGKKSAITILVEAVPKVESWFNELETQLDSLQATIEFVNFMADSLKPYIDSHFRTFNDAGNTLIFGAEFNANLAYLAFISRNEIFGKAAIFSPSQHFLPDLQIYTDSLAAEVSGKLFYYYGEKSLPIAQDQTDAMILSLGEKSKAVIYSLMDTDGWNNIEYWRKYFPEFYIWALADGNNFIINSRN